MEKANELLNKLGFSDEFIEMINKDSFETIVFQNNFDNAILSNSFDVEVKDNNQFVIYETIKPVSHFANTAN